MAKGNMLLGYSRGSVGDVTFTKIKGQQVAKARNRNPHNPRTNKQSFQRAIFAAAVKFYTRGNQAFYKFAFENKRQVESDYNAFMRENVKRAPAISRRAFANYDYPVFAPFIMAKGSLQPIVCENNRDSVLIQFGVPAPAEAPTTVGGLSQALIESERFEVGDILTYVQIVSDYNATYPSVADGANAPKWDIKQIILDPTNTTTLADALQLEVVPNMSEITLKSTSGMDPFVAYTYAAYTLVHTRNTSTGLKASTQELVLDDDATTAYEATQAEAYKQTVIASWQANGSVDAAPEAILQGSIAYES